MAAIMDIMISFVIGGVLLMIILTANEIAAENHMVYNGDMLVQEMLVSTVAILEGEFRNMGFGVDEATPTITWGDSASVSFLSDLDRNDATPPDTIHYFIGPVSELSGTQNEIDRLLHRRVNNGTVSSIGAVTIFRLSYLTQDGVILPRPVPAPRLSEIHTVEVSIEVQNPYAPLNPLGSNPEALFSSSLWQQTRLASQNTRR
ncbi:MAG: hypothetical protein OEV30_06485 [Ignavibacteria bacterium]|nr:hypothetical protein [Ignavibacteria bacterium]